jgi:4-amino-4-deoxychorismate lyase
MFPFIETIRLEDGVLCNLEYHQERMERTQREVFPGTDPTLLTECVRIPDEAIKGLFRCRFRYGREPGPVEIEPYNRRTVGSLKLVRSDSVTYRYKYLDRSNLETLFRQRGHCDDILIVKNGLITDSFLANVVLWDGKEWITPDSPLLPGTMRAFLLDRGDIHESPVRTGDLHLFSRICLINAMNNLDEASEIPVTAVFQ